MVAATCSALAEARARMEAARRDAVAANGTFTVQQHSAYLITWGNVARMRPTFRTWWLSHITPACTPSSPAQSQRQAQPPVHSDGRCSRHSPSCRVHLFPVSHPPTPLSAQTPGGASFSLHSLQCALIGAALAIPPVAARAYLWSPEAAEQLPPLGDMHRLKAEEAEPFLSQYNKGHVLVHAVLEIIPVALLLLPAAQGGLSAGLEFYSSLLQQSLFGSGAAAAAAASTMEAAAGGGAAGAAVPGGLGALLALIITATCTGVVQSWEIATDEEQVEVVKDAVQNADR